MDSKLVCPSCVGIKTYKGKSLFGGSYNPYSLPMGYGLLTVLPVHNLPGPVVYIQSYRHVYVASFLLDYSFKKGDVGLLDFPVFKLKHQVFHAFFVEGQNKESRCVHIKPMYMAYFRRRGKEGVESVGYTVQFLYSSSWDAEHSRSFVYDSYGLVQV